MSMGFHMVNDVYNLICIYFVLENFVELFHSMCLQNLWIRIA